MHARTAPRKTVSPATAPAASALAALAVANIALAFGPWFVRLAETGPVATGFWRITLAAPLLSGMAWASGGRVRGISRALLVTIVIGGVCFAADLGSWHIGILRTKLTNATLFGNAAILLFPIYGFIVARRWPNRIQALALALALAGATLLLGRSYEIDPRNMVGDLLCLTAGLLYTVYFICMSRVRAVLPPLLALALSTVASILPLLGFALVMGERIVPTHWGPLIGVALVSQVIGQGLMIYALGRLSPLIVGIALLIQPVVAGTVGWLAYGERLTLLDWIGAALVAIALILVRAGERPALASVEPGEQ